MANHPNRSKKFGPRDVELIADAINSLDVLLTDHPYVADNTRNRHRLKWRNACRALDRLRAVKT
jgi:hypothetical protein